MYPKCALYMISNNYLYYEIIHFWPDALMHKAGQGEAHFKLFIQS